MSYYEHDEFQLPTISLVGGTTERIVFHLWNVSHDAIDLAGTCTFALASFVNPDVSPIFTKTMTVSEGESSGINNIATVALSGTDTRDLDGKYIYQITLRSASEIDVQQGVMYITRNRNRSVIV